MESNRVGERDKGRLAGVKPAGGFFVFESKAFHADNI